MNNRRNLKNTVLNSVISEIPTHKVNYSKNIELAPNNMNKTSVFQETLVTEKERNILNLMTKQHVLSAIVLILFVAQTAYSQGTWSWRNPFPQGNNLNAIHVFDENNVVTMGNHGTVMQVAPDGFTVNFLPYFADLRDVKFINSQVAYAVGGADYIIKTADAGKTWNRLENLPISLTTSAVDFLDENIGWVVGESGKILKTTDAGNNWVEQNSGQTKRLSSINMVNENVGWIVGAEGLVLKTTNGGSSWSVVNFGITNNLNDVFFLSETRGYIVGNSGRLYKTTNGATFTLMSAGTSYTGFSVYFLNDLIGWIATPDGILRTTDGGLNWALVVSGQEQNKWVRDVYFIDEFTGYVCTDGGGVSKSTDGGLTWINITSSGSSRVLYGIDFVNEEIGYSIGFLGDVFKTTNGIDWEEISSAPISVNYFDFIDENTGWAVGSNAKIAKTTDGGQNWVEQSSNSNVSTTFWDVQFIDSQNGFAVGSSGTFLKTVNGGDTWSSVIISSQTLYAVHFIDANTGWVCGQTGALLKTTNGGANWTGQSNASNNTLYDIQFLDANIGYASSSGSIVYKTTNGGANWTDQLMPLGAALWNLDFVDANIGWAVGSNGRVFYTVNGGDEWVAQQTFTDQFIYGLDALNANKAVIGTTYSGIISYFNFVPDVVSLSLSSEKTEVNTNDTLTIQVRIGDSNEAEDVIGASLELAWDSDAFEYIDDSAEMGDFFTSNPLFFATKKSGERVIDLSAGSGLSQGTNGSGSIANLKFKAISDANVSFSIQNSRVEKKSGESLDVEVSGLDVSISALITTVISSISPISTENNSTITIAGENFGETQGESTVRLGPSFEVAFDAFIVSWSDTEIKFFVFDTIELGEYSVWLKVGNQIVLASDKLNIEEDKLKFRADNLTPFTTSIGVPSAAQSVIIYGNRLTNSVAASLSSSRFELSKTENGTYSSLLDFPISGDMLSESQIWIRLAAPDSEGDFEDNLFISSENAIGRSIVLTSKINPAGSPIISSISPKIGSIGTEVTINGTNFGSAQDGSTLKMGLNSSSTITLTPSSWSDTEIKVTLPDLSIIGDYSFYVTVNSIEAISSDAFTYVSSSSPLITAISPFSLQPEEIITISGNNFGIIQGSSKVWIGSDINSRSEVAPQSWSETQVTVQIPSFFSTGFYSVWLEISGNLVEGSQQIQIVKTEAVNDNTITLNGVNGKSGNPVTGNRPFIEFQAVADAQDYRITMESNSGSNFIITTETSFIYPHELNYGETYTVTITPRFVVESGSEPIDGPSVSIVFNVFSYSSTVSNSVSYSPSGDLLASDFRLLGISGASTSISSLISIPTEEYKVFRWSGSSFSEFYSSSVPGEGYWVIAASPFQVSTAPASVTLDDNNAYSIPIKSDWNIIANPFGTSITWTDELSGGQDLYEWTGNWVPTTLLQPSKAYAWKNTTENSELVLNYYDLIVNQGSAKRSLSSDNQASKKQVITLLAQGDESFGTRSVQLAIYPESQNQNLNKFDTELPPQPFEVSQLALIDETNETSKFIRKALISSETGYSVPLAFELLESQNLQLQVEFTDELNEAGLINLANGRYYSLTKDLIQINLPKGNHKFQFVAGESSFINEQQAALMPKDFSLVQNYPNPFNPSTQIAFSLPTASTVKLEVFDLLGRRVALLADGMLNAGYHTRLFDGSDLSSGMYLYRIQAGEFVQVKKMMMLK